jgi:hypothetical protein
MMTGSVTRRAPDFSGFPDLVVMMLGMQVRTWFGIRTLVGFRKPLELAGAARPEGLLHYENNIVFSLAPMHVGMRWYWRDMASLEAWAKSEPHRTWWRNFLKDSRGTGFWHETYHMRGGMEAIYDDVTEPVGFSRFMPMLPARGTLSSRHKNWASADMSGLPLENWPDGPPAAAERVGPP